MWYPEIPESGPSSGEYGPINHSFPLTPIALHEGWIEGKERTITCVSGRYSWPHKQQPIVRVFGLDGRPKAHETTAQRDGKGWTIDLKLRDWAELAAISETE